MDDILHTLAPLVINEGYKFIAKKTSNPANDLAAEASASNTEAIRKTLRNDPYINRGPALVAAAAAGHLSALDLLVEEPSSSHHHHHHDHSKSPPGSSPKESRKTNLDIWASGSTPLLSAVKNKHVKTTDFLLESGADPDFASKDRTTALQLAARMGDTDICKILLDFGADVNHQNAAGDTALIMASRFDHAPTVKCLLENGADVDTQNKKWSTALLVAARHDAIDVLEILLRYGADPRVRDKKGRSPLHRAVEGIWLVEGVPGTVKEDMVRKLLRAGANPEAKDLEGKTAAQRAGWLTGGEGLRKLLEGRSRSIERLQPDRMHSRSKTF
jgi:hypothetical protein